MREKKDKEESELVRYLLSAKWWEKWRDFANFSTDFLKRQVQEKRISEAGESINASPSPSVCGESIFSSPIAGLDDNNISVLYGKPGIIQNQDLLLNKEAKSSCGAQGQLKPNLELNFDYVYVNKEVW